MGLYPITCPQCKQPHIWFSGTMDQRCGNCRNPREYSIKMKNDGTGEGWVYPMDPTREAQNPISGCQVIEKSAFDFQCKQVSEIVDTFNKSSEHWQGLIKELQHQLYTEKAEVGRLLALLKRRNKK